MTSNLDEVDAWMNGVCARVIRERDALAREVERLRAELEGEEHQSAGLDLAVEDVQRENERLRAWAEDEQAKRHKCEDQRTEERSENAQLLALLEHPSGRPCPWCLTPTGFVHGRHCELATALGRDKEC